MTIKDLKKLIKGLPNDMEVMIKEDDLCFPACNGDSDIVTIEFDDGEEMCLMLAPCHHCEDEEDAERKIDLDINLN